MSRNKDIEWLHSHFIRIGSPRPYSYCRQLMKKNKWNLWEALDMDQVIENLCKNPLDRALDELNRGLDQALDSLNKSFARLCEQIDEALSS